MGVFEVADYESKVRIEKKDKMADNMVNTNI